MTSYYALLPEKDNFLRLRDCDFNNKSYNINEIDNSKIPITLKNITNPILILFYYNDTEQRILTEFYLSSKEELEEGNQEDQIFKNFDNTFKFGYVNLDLEKEVEENFQNMENANPFTWVKIEKFKDSTGAEKFSKEPFILFYYQTLPQFNYEGVVDSDAIKKEFKKWRKDLIEIENKEIKKEINHDGYYTAIKDDIPVAGVKAGKTYWMKILERAGRYIIEATLIN